MAADSSPRLTMEPFNESPKLRPWRTIAKELTVEHDRKRFTELTKELLAAMDEQNRSKNKK